jgi:SAM-dependent methyltransferase
MDLRNITKKTLRKNGKTDFLSNLDSRSSILDVGCGNNSPYYTKKILPNCTYTGLDVGDYNQTKPLLADNYIVTKPEEFAKTIRTFFQKFDAVISSHNLEHCDERSATLGAMMDALKIGGKLFLSFPCENSVGFPKREGTLNYFDDPTHKLDPPDFDEIILEIESKGFEIEYAERNYSPGVLRVLGMFLEPISALKCRVMIGTWEYYGFESIVIARKLKQSLGENKPLL